jgi:hypothetical protein
VITLYFTLMHKAFQGSSAAFALPGVQTDSPLPNDRGVGEAVRVSAQERGCLQLTGVAPRQHSGTERACLRCV